MPAPSEGRPGYLQHKIRPEVKRWLESESARLERSQAWVLNKIVEDAYSARAVAQRDAGKVAKQ